MLQVVHIKSESMRNQTGQGTILCKLQESKSNSDSSWCFSIVAPTLQGILFLSVKKLSFFNYF